MTAWTFEPLVVLPAVAAAALYLRGWRVLARRMPERFDGARAGAFLGGIAALLIAACSPLDPLGHRLLQAHMVQHLLLMIVAPPLLWLGAPIAPLLLGLPRPARRTVAMALAIRPMRRLASALADSRVSWALFVLAFWAWHVPALYDLALRSDAWHHVEHACFLLTALAFWRPIILPWPARAAGPRWAMIIYLLLAEAQNTALAVILTFSDRVIYQTYRGDGAAALDDQALAGVIMWVPGSIAFALALLRLIFQSLGAESRAHLAEASLPAPTTKTPG
jgi:cytochrome c oxidase assembly factor CtaG